MKRIGIVAQGAILIALASGSAFGQAGTAPVTEPAGWTRMENPQVENRQVENPQVPTPFGAPPPDTPYVIAADDQVAIRVADMEEIGSAAQTVDIRGNIVLPRLGRIHVAGLTAEQVEVVLAQRLGEYLRNPDVLVTVTPAPHTQPVAVIGMVSIPGIQQIRGSKTLFEVISAAGGLRADAGETIKVTRRKDVGPLPLQRVTDDETGEYSVGEVSSIDVLNATNPRANIEVKPHDIISVAKADMIYVLGSVNKPGAYILSKTDNVSLLKAVALANGLLKTATGKDVRILRTVQGSDTRTEIHVDLRSIMYAKAADFQLQREDILFVPNSQSRNVAVRTLEAVVGLGTGLALYAVHP
jgi:polysaccharide export outer membrane protein